MKTIQIDVDSGRTDCNDDATDDYLTDDEFVREVLRDVLQNASDDAPRTRRRVEQASAGRWNLASLDRDELSNDDLWTDTSDGPRRAALACEIEVD